MPPFCDVPTGLHKVKLVYPQGYLLLPAVQYTKYNTYLLLTIGLLASGMRSIALNILTTHVRIDQCLAIPHLSCAFFQIPSGIAITMLLLLLLLLLLIFPTNSNTFLGR